MERELLEDLILEIISLLPLKLLVQCKCLSKNFNLKICDPRFQFKNELRSSTTFDCFLYYSTYQSGMLSKFELQSHKHSSFSLESVFMFGHYYGSFTMPFTLLSSSGGLLLLEFHRQFRGGSLCVFNPITAAYRLIPSLRSSTGDNNYVYGFTGQFTKRNNINNNFELVAVSIRWLLPDQTVYKSYIFEPDANIWRRSSYVLRSRVPNPTGSSWGFLDRYQAIYLDDSFYWLKKDGEVLVFNLKTEISQIISVPIPKDLFKPDMCCFEVIRDKIAIVTAEYDNIFVYLYDFAYSTWKLDKILHNKKKRIISGLGDDRHDCSSSIDYHSTVFPLFYDGKRLISEMVTILPLAKGVESKLCLDDLTTNSCQEIPIIPYRYDKLQRFRHFSGTLAEISGCNYLPRLQQQQRPEDLEVWLSILYCIQMLVYPLLDD